MVLGRGVAIVLQIEQLRAVLDEILQEVLDVLQQQLDAALVQGRVGQHGAQLDEQAQEVDGAVYFRHGLVRVGLEDLGVLGPLEFVEQLGTQHHVEVFFYA